MFNIQLKNNPVLKGIIIKLSIMAIIWFGVYNYYLQPKRIPDRVLTNFIASNVSKMISVTFPAKGTYSWAEGSVVVDSTKIFVKSRAWLEAGGIWHNEELHSAGILYNNQLIFNINDTCNGLEIMMIFVAFIIILQGSLMRKTAFIIGGLLVLIIANIIRSYALYYIFINYPKAFDVNHHYVFTLLMYVLIIYGWMLFTDNKKIETNEA